MLLVKPLILKKRLEAHEQLHGNVQHEHIAYEVGNDGKTLVKNSLVQDIKAIMQKEGGAGQESHNFGDIFIH